MPDHVRTADHDQRRKRQQEIGRKSERDGGKPEHCDRPKHGRAGVAVDRQPRQHDADQQRAERRAGPKDAELGRADMQDILGEDRQQRRDSAEQHRKQVERHGAEDQLIVAHVAEAREGLLPGRARGTLLDARRRLHRQDQQRSQRRQRHQQQEDLLCDHRVDEAADRRADHRGELHRRGREGDGLRELLARDDVRQEGRGRGHRERARAGDDHRHQVDRQRVRRQVVDAEIEPERADCLRALRQHHHLAAVVVIGGIAGQRQQRNRRCKLCESDQPEAERAARLRIDEPAEGYGLHLHRQHDAHPRNDETEQVRLRVNRGRCHLALGAVLAPVSWIRNSHHHCRESIVRISDP